MTAGRRSDDPTRFDVEAVPSATGWVLSVRGDVDACTAPRLGDLLLDVLSRPGAADVDLDLREVTFLDSAGLHALVTAHGRAQGLGVRLRVLVATRAVLRPIQVTGLEGVLGVERVETGVGAA